MTIEAVFFMIIIFCVCLGGFVISLYISSKHQ
ncbi:MAG: MetS family NSS transporter small subunit [Candidatus Aminicenantes bacterium]|nr:MetS family NSS transporter small subunit [Candidatus Aminicenantes bacterium]